ncbi:MAG TPA: ABC transporter ATP-binding protein [Pseudomonadales bacterium]|nr:ABC transporter ATP-binding protein [Pseudomonadales bacterium]
MRDARMSDAPILEVRDLVCEFDTDAGTVRAVDGVSFSVDAGRTLGIVGESGCGKSVTALSITQLLPQPMARIAGGSVRFEGSDLVNASETELHAVRGNRIGMIFQEPMTALNPVHRIGKQIAESLILHRGLDQRAALEAAVDLLRRVGIPAPELRIGEYPHQLSGGMRQRVMIAIALACDPVLLIADEPTTALDVTIQAQILELIERLQRDTGMAMILITHDLGVIAETCDEVAVMYAGRIAERAPVETLFAAPRHPYTVGLLASIPRLDSPRKTRLPTIEGQVPGLLDMPAGCRFAGRCPHRTELCDQTPPPLVDLGGDHLIACHHHDRIAAAAGAAAPRSAGSPA